MITARDESFHENSGDLFWSESGWFSFSVPEKKTHGFVNFFHRPNMHHSVGGLGLWDPAGEDIYNCLYYDWGTIQPTPPGADVFDFRLDNSLAVECVDPLKRYHIEYKSQDCQLALDWEAIMEPHEQGFPKGTEEFGGGHYGQGGHVTGSVMVHGETLEVNCFSNRDRSWGPRRPSTNPRGGFPWAIASDRSGFQAWSLSDLAPDADPIAGTTERAFGWHLQDGVVAPLAPGSTRRVVERGDDGRPMRVVVSAEDELGRVVDAEGTCLSTLKFVWHNYFMWWCLVEWQFNGKHAWGEEQEYYPWQQSRRYFHSLRR